jgi:hypothetical protein
MFWKESAREARQGRAAPLAAPEPFACTGLARFLRRVARVESPPHLLMLGELCGENVSFLGERGFRVSVATDVPSGEGASYAGALLWDALASMHPVEARRRTAILKEAIVPGGAVLAFFGPVGAAAARSRTRYRIVDEERVFPEPVQGRAGLTQPYENREILGLFAGFDLDHLHTRRNGQREFLFFRTEGPSKPAGPRRGNA